MNNLMRLTFTLLAAAALFGAAGAASQSQDGDTPGQHVAGGTATCDADPKAAYLECVDRHQCDSHPLPEQARERCDACWQTYQKDISGCSDTVTADRQPPNTAYPSKK